MTKTGRPTALIPEAFSWPDFLIEAAITARSPQAARNWLVDAHTKGWVNDGQWERYQGRCQPDER